MCKNNQGKQSHPHTRALKKEHLAADSNSNALFGMRAGEPITLLFFAEDVSRQGNDSLVFSLSNVELTTKPKLNIDFGGNIVSLSALQKLPLRRNVNGEGK
ncbi:hypothetical protein RJT34_07584 [Clitoria ternatea]|uniref:Uncharacterized protein n=1 Tax=Clitoria ternatea TaxID=43366 RepID=A0AAN9K575_CLITE